MNRKFLTAKILSLYQKEFNAIRQLNSMQNSNTVPLTDSPIFSNFSNFQIFFRIVILIVLLYLEKQSVSKSVLPFHCLKNFWNSKLEIIFSFVRSEILETKYSFISIFGNKELVFLVFFGLSLFQILRYFFKKLN